MFAKPPEAVVDELFEKMPYPITLQDFITNIISVYPVQLGALKLFKKENNVEVFNFSFNPPITPIEIMLQQAISQATQQTQQKIENGMFMPTINNTIGISIINNFYQNREIIEGETGVKLEDLLMKECEPKRQEKNSSIILTDAQGNVEGDVIEIVLDF